MKLCINLKYEAFVAYGTFVPRWSLGKFQLRVIIKLSQVDLGHLVRLEIIMINSLVIWGQL